MNIKEIINALNMLVLCVLFYFVPEGVSPVIMWGCLFVFYYYFYLAIKTPLTISAGIPSYFKAELLFLMFYYLIYYLPYQLALLGMADLYVSHYVKFLYMEYANVSIVTSTIGLVAFSTGFQKTFKFPRTNCETEVNYYRYLPSVILFFLLLFLGLYAVTGAQAMLSGAYATSDVGSRAENGIFILVSYFVMFSLAVSVFFISENKLPLAIKISLALAAGWCMLLLIVGDRNTFFLITLVPLTGVASYIWKVSLKQMILLVFAALFLYNIVEIARQAEERGVSAIFDAATEGGEHKSLEEGSFSITTVTSRAAFDIVPEKHEYFMGKFKVIGIAGIIPFSRGLFVPPSDLYSTSSRVLGDEMLGPWASWGVGSNIISDIYMDFGILGVIILMYVLGWAGSYVQTKVAANSRSIMWGTVYLMMVAFYAEYPRYSFDFPVRYIAWTFILFSGYKFILRRHRQGGQNDDSK